MNERIRELAEQASKEVFPINSIAFMEKFAELIVRECVEVVNWTPSMFPNDTVIKNIKQHFGVVE
jgi:hypothetical protein